MMFIITANFNYVNVFGDVLNNWTNGPIEDLRLIKKTSAESENICPNDYEYLFKFTWPGTRLGCDCREIINSKTMSEYEFKIKTGSCTLAQTSDGCTKILEIPGKQIHSINDSYYCIKRHDNFNYEAYYGSNIYEKKCPPDFKECGVVDTLGNLLCVPKESKCQIDINPYTNNNSSTINQLKSYFPEIVKSFIDIKISQGPPCIHPLEINLMTDQTYDLINLNRKMKCPTKIHLGYYNSLQTDNRYLGLINFSTSSIFFDEDYLNTNIQTLPEFPKEYFELPATIYGRKYIGWNKRCKSYISKFYATYKFLSNLEGLSLIYLVFSLIILIYCMILIMILSELLQKNYKLKLLITTVYCIIVLFIFLYILSDKFTLSDLSDFTYVLVKNSCSDYETNILLVNVHILITEIENFYVLTLIFYLCILFIGLLKILLIIYKLYKNNLLNRLIRGNVTEFEMVLLI